MRSVLLSLLPSLLIAQTPQEPAHIQAFQATATTVRKGATVTLRWNATGTGQVRLDPLGLILPAKGEITHVVTGRTVYWLHATNGDGGQSAPLVVDVLPDEPGRVPLKPPVLAQPVLPMELPKLAELPAPPPQVPSPLAPRNQNPHQVRHSASRRVWIQFAAMIRTQPIARLQRNLQRVAGTGSTVTARHRRTGRPVQLIRSGPFPSVQAAKSRLRELAKAMETLKLKPILIFGPAMPIAAEPTYLAEARRPE